MIINDKQFEAVFASTKTSCITFSLDKSADIGPLNSSIASIPYWDKDSESYPANNDGPLKLLAQINFEELSNFFDIIPNFPKSGILQFFMPPLSTNPEIENSEAKPIIADDKSKFSGYFNNSFNTYPNKANNSNSIAEPPIPSKNALKNYAVRFHDSPNIEKHSLTPQQMSVNTSPLINKTILSPLKMLPNLKVEYCGLGDEYWSYYLYEHTTMNDEQEKRLFNCINGGVKLNGYSYFHSSDPRPLEGYSRVNPWVLLLQIDSIYIAENLQSAKQINLASNKGIISFFIRQQDLINKNFNSDTILMHKDSGYHPYKSINADA